MTVINNYDTWIALMQLVNVQQNGQIPPSVFNKWYNEVSDWYFKKLAEEYQTAQVQSDLLSPFVKAVNVPVVMQPGYSWGLCNYPSDYEYFLSAQLLRQEVENTCFYNKELPIIDGDGASKKYTDPDFAQMTINFAGANVVERSLQLIDTQRWSSCLNHTTKGPTWDSPKMTQFQGGFRVAPKGISSIVLYYLKTPVQSVFNYTISADDIAIYTPGTSVQLEWSVQVRPVFLAELQKKYAAYVGDSTMYQMADNDKNKL